MQTWAALARPAVESRSVRCIIYQCAAPAIDTENREKPRLKGVASLRRFERLNSGNISAPMSRSSTISAGLLAFRRRHGLEVLLAHPGGPFWSKKDAGVWTIPKGLAVPGEDLLAAAQREFTEETNFSAGGPFIALTPVKQKGGKVVKVWAVEADFDLAHFASNPFEIEWPPKSGRRQNFPEIDRVAYFTAPIAATKILAYQRPLLRELEQHLK
jgi:predicted NUDIX family NTP pyrophosphohydrolase